MPITIELTADEVAIVLEWSANGASGFNPSKEEEALHSRLQTFLEINETEQPK
jgi:hypothetical protein